MTTKFARRATRRGAPTLDLEARLALADAVMSGRLDEAAMAFEVNTAHISATPALVPDRLQPTKPARQFTPYRTPIAACLQRAQAWLVEAGWCAGTSRDEKGAVCLMQAIRAEARNRREADDACVFLLEVIRQSFPNAETVPSWNDAQRDARLPIRMLGHAADRADARGI
ncbi:DUF6197 family protein [Streptomyces asiaticus]